MGWAYHYCWWFALVVPSGIRWCSTRRRRCGVTRWWQGWTQEWPRCARWSSKPPAWTGSRRTRRRSSSPRWSRPRPTPLMIRWCRTNEGVPTTVRPLLSLLRYQCMIRQMQNDMAQVLTSPMVPPHEHDKVEVPMSSSNVPTDGDCGTTLAAAQEDGLPGVVNIG